MNTMTLKNNKSDEVSLKNTTVLVTGASGFIGTNLMLELGKRGADIIAIDKNPISIKSIKIKITQFEAIVSFQI